MEIVELVNMDGKKMKIVQGPLPITSINKNLIPLSDGMGLAAKISLPEGAILQFSWDSIVDVFPTANAIAPSEFPISLHMVTRASI